MSSELVSGFDAGLGYSEGPGNGFKDGPHNDRKTCACMCVLAL